MEAGVLVPPYRRIADDLRGRIEAGEFRPGDRLPSARAITREWAVAIATATKALAVLRDEGLTVPRPGVGTVVAVRPVRRTERELTPERVVRAAIAIADAQGMGELSMRRVAAGLGVATMSLYRHVSGKAELVLAMIDAAFGDFPVPARRPAGWRAQLELCARLEWAVFQRHPWLAPSMSLARPDLSANAVRLTEWVLAALDDTGLDLSSRMYVHILLFSFVRGVATALEAEVEAVRETGMDSDEWFATQEPVFASMIGELPHFRRFATEPFDFSLDTLFEFGLARLLDGVGDLIAARSRPRSAG
jgi:AcrR family transcriptional regulator